MALNPGGLKSRYEVKDVIARGGMGVVYRAYDKVLKRSVAIKTILDLTDSKAIKSFQKECEDLASLSHPNIIEIFDVGQMQDEEGTKPYLVMPLLPGVTLDELIRTSSSRLTVERCVDIFCQTCRGLHAAHERGLIHRDLKPSNLFVMDDDSVKIIDFGVAHRVNTSQTVGRKGTLLYMSPEQILMRPLTPASDIFSLGVVCYEALTLRRPFERRTEGDVAESILKEVLPPIHELNPSVPVILSQAVYKAMAKDIAHRYRTAREFGDTLQRAFHNEPIEMFNPARIRPRLQRAREAFQKGNFEYAGEIVGELAAEGHLDPEITEVRDAVSRAQMERRVAQLIETARARLDEQEHQLALQKVDEALQLDPKNTEALALKARIDTKRTERDIEGWFELARTHIDNLAFGPAREALRRILELRPRETKAAQLLSEVERVEQNQQRLKGEKEGLYRAAAEAERAGDLSSALSKLERVLDLDKQAPEPSRTGTYQRQYEKIHSEHESLKAARSEAKNLLDAQKFAQALAVCNEYLLKYPADTLLRALKWDIEEKQRQAVSARIAETDRRVEAEPDLDRCVSILEQAVAENPGEPHLERALQNVRDKRDGVNAIVARARSLEERGQFTEALAQWEMLQTIYSRYPGLRLEIDRLSKRRDHSLRQEQKAKFVDQIDQHLNTGDFARALSLVEKAEQEFPQDPELAELGRLAKQGLAVRAEAQELLNRGREACDAGRVKEGLDHFRRAHELDNNDGAIRNLLLETLIEEGKRLMESDPAIAEELLNEALSLEPNHALAIGLLRMFADQRKFDTLDRALAQARRLQASGELKQALDVVAQALKSHPNEQRLIQLRNSLSKSLDDQRRRDLDQARRLSREMETIGLDDDRRGEYEGRLEKLLSTYADDGEFLTATQGAQPRPHDLTEALTEVQDFTVDDSASRVDPAAAALSAGGGGQTPGQRRFWEKLGPPRGSKHLILGAAGLALIGIVAFLLLRHSGQPEPVRIVKGSVNITTVPAGATVYINGEEAGNSRDGLTVYRRPDTYELICKLPGYQTLTQNITIKQGSPASLALTLIPEVPVLRVVGAGTLYLDSDPAVEMKEGQFQIPLSVAEHTVRVAMARSSSLSFKVRVASDGLPVVSEVNARELTPLIVNNFGASTKIYSGSNTPVAVHMNGQKLGTLTAEGFDLPSLDANNYDLQIGEGKDAKTQTIETGPARSLTVLLAADPNVGRLLVQTNEDDVSVAVISNGKELYRKTTQNRQVRFANLRARAYTVQAGKTGYDSEGDKPVTIAKGAEATVAFELHRLVSPGTIQVKTLAGSDVFLNARKVATAGADGTVTIPNVPAGPYRVEARLKQYQSRSAALTLAESETRTVELTLVRAGGRVQIRRSPSEAIVTYRKVDQDKDETVAENPLSLAEGTYLFTAAAPGYVRKSVNAQVRADETIEVTLNLAAVETELILLPTDYWPKETWVQPRPRDWFEHNGEAFLGTTRIGPALIEFDAPLSQGSILSKDRLVWATNYRDARNYVKFELTDKNLEITKIKDGKSTKLPPKPVKLSGVYSIRLDWHADSITVKVNESVQELHAAEPGEFQQGRFGFLQNKLVRMQNFRMKAGK